MPIAPGKHSLLLNITDIQEAFGNTGRGTTGEVGAYTEASNPIIDVDLIARHVYRIGANLEGDAIKVSLWDETDGVTGRICVATWNVDSSGGYTEAIVPVGPRH